MNGFAILHLLSEELRNEFDYMADVAGCTPEQYALRVQNTSGSFTNFSIE